MEDLFVSNVLEIASYKGKYNVYFNDDKSIKIDDEIINNSHFIIDKKIAELYASSLKNILSSRSVLLIDATEKNKSLEQMPFYVDHLVQHKLRRNQRLVAIGGGIIQDITCFLAANMLRGVNWWFYPTTLLAQADSCIGSKSSINCGNTKNILGTFTPPEVINIHSVFLDTLSLVELRSGIGEMLKVHAIDGNDAFQAIANDYELLFKDPALMTSYIRRSLEIKKAIIEQDEFDQHIRHVMNYGHSFGHAIESATDYKIPHGVAVTIGMDMANYVAMHSELTPSSHYKNMHSILKKNYADYVHEAVSLDKFISAISKDKKNIDDRISLILPNKEGKPGKVFLNNDQRFRQLCNTFLDSERTA